MKKVAPKNFAKLTGKHLCQSLFFNKDLRPTTLFKKETVTHVFSCEFCENKILMASGGCLWKEKMRSVLYV